MNESRLFTTERCSTIAPGSDRVRPRPAGLFLFQALNTERLQDIFFVHRFGVAVAHFVQEILLERHRG